MTNPIVVAVVAVIVAGIGAVVYTMVMDSLENSPLVQNTSNGQQTWEQLKQTVEQQDALEEGNNLQAVAKKPNNSFDVLIYGLPIALIIALVAKAAKIF